jgi:hypothetical protein
VHGLERVALVDFDVHHGNGSEDILHDDERVLMCSIFEDKLYPFCGNVPRGPNMVNVALPARSGSDALRQAVLEKCDTRAGSIRPSRFSFRPASMATAMTTWATWGGSGLRLDHQTDRRRSTPPLPGPHRPLSGRRLRDVPLARSAAAHVKVLLGMDD